MSRSFGIAAINGTSVRLHWTFLLFLGLIAASAFMSMGLSAARDIMLLIILMFACIVLHEFGHISVARKFGIETPEVVLLPIGGLAKLKRIPNEPEKELAIAIAGPVVNFVLFGLLVLLLGRWPNWQALSELAEGKINLIEQLAIFNLVVGVFNLLPAFPMDGGRILRALLAFALPHSKATSIATRIGQLLAVGLGLAALLMGNLLLAAIGVFIFLAATTEERIGRIRDAIGGLPVAQVMVTGHPLFSETDPISCALDEILHTDSDEFPVLTSGGELLGFLLRSDVIRHAGDAGAQKTAGEIMRTDIPVVPMHYRAEKAADLISGGAPIVGVTDRRGGFAGIVNWRNLLDAMEIDSAIARRSQQLDKRTSL
ncbi:MAG: site-2 protease family protein [Erythrobacter sp.]|uniref:site-2 protease family protein n=1 Tax=Erythrobacter sp. TaxID=1042 RepID=UPI0026175178|nr:site-2 protease family protein [Erythrobacter sp.]MDJ0977577.1 site-2 protease family protein [Erythrobacter sp.]